MHRIYPALKACDVLVLASPVYFYALSSWVKAVPSTAARAHHARRRGARRQWPLRVPPGKGFDFISTQAEESPLYGYQILPGLVYGFTWTGIALRGHLIATGLDGPHDWEAREDLVAAARELIAVA